MVPPYYDSMVAKLIVHAPTRLDAINRLRRALDEFAILGIQTTVPLHRRIVDDPGFQAGDYTIQISDLADSLSTSLTFKAAKSNGGHVR